MNVKREPLQHYLNLFNRKERNLLIRDALGEVGGGPDAKLKISSEYMGRLAERLEIKVPDSNLVSWWTDYHFDWLAAALAVYARPDKLEASKVGGTEKKSFKREFFKNVRKSGFEKPLMRGNQEDIDLLISFSNAIVLVEAKAYSSLTLQQLKSKVNRLRQIQLFYQSFRGKKIGLDQQSLPDVAFHFLLTSPSNPLEGRQAKAIEEIGQTIKVRWMKMEIAEINGKFRVTRCNAEGKRAPEGDVWHCRRAQRFKSLDGTMH